MARIGPQPLGMGRSFADRAGGGPSRRREELVVVGGAKLATNQWSGTIVHARHLRFTRFFDLFEPLLGLFRTASR